jgi:segregation and condensation protein A
MSADGDTFDPGAAAWSLQLPHFEGPLDLLLHLCQKHELDILDIPISFVTEKYLAYLSLMQLMQLDVAAEYLVMAATLAHIKSKMLLPAPPPGQEDDEIAEDEIDPREALIHRLLEYQKYKDAGEQLAARGVAGRDVFLRGAPAAASPPWPTSPFLPWSTPFSASSTAARSSCRTTS